MRDDLSQTRLNRVPGEVKALECRWTSPGTLLYDCRRVYAGEAEEIDLEEEVQRMNHCHRVQDKDGEGYWDEILAYLHESFVMMDGEIAQSKLDNLTAPMKGPYAGDNRLEVLNSALWHISDHYGQLVEYVRMNGIVPPASRWAPTATDQSRHLKNRAGASPPSDHEIGRAHV